jgi:hypothetical protein
VQQWLCDVQRWTLGRSAMPPDARALAAAVASFAAVAAAVSASQAALVAACAAVTSSTLLAAGGVRVPEYWVRQRAPSWWETEVPGFSDEEFRDHFRVCRATFVYIVERLRPAVQRKDTRLRKAVLAELIVACSMRRLATGDSFQTIAAMFGVNRSSAKKFNDRTVRALVAVRACMAVGAGVSIAFCVQTVQSSAPPWAAPGEPQ